MDELLAIIEKDPRVHPNERSFFKEQLLYGPPRGIRRSRHYCCGGRERKKEMDGGGEERKQWGYVSGMSSDFLVYGQSTLECTD